MFWGFLRMSFSVCRNSCLAVVNEQISNEKLGQIVKMILHVYDDN